MMMNKQNYLFNISVFVITFCVVFSLQATTLNELLAKKQVNVTIRLQNEAIIVAKQAVVIEIETSTPYWFATGSKVDNPKIANAIILPGEQLAINSTKKINGITWVSQIREVTLYPIEQGKYQIPPIGVFISINTPSSGIIEGQLFTPSISFNAQMPDELERLSNYIVTADFQINSKDDFVNNQTYQVGDAVSQTIVFLADSVPAMMLAGYDKPKLDGISIYRKPVQLQDKISRGVRTGIRTETITYIFEQAGEYTIPAQSYYWWNPATNILEQTKIASKHWLVTKATTQEKQQSEESIWPKTRLYSVIFIGIVFLLGLLFFLYLHNAIKFNTTKKSQKNKQYKSYSKAYLKAIKQKKYQDACSYLYKIYDINTNQSHTLRHYFNQHSNKNKQKLLEQLLQLAYQSSDNDINFTVSDAKLLLANKNHNIAKLTKDPHHIGLNTL